MFPIPAHLPRTGPAPVPDAPVEAPQSDPTLDLLAPFLDTSTAEAGPSRWTAKRATDVRISLEQAVTQNKAKQHELLLANFATVSSHIQLTEVLRADHGRISTRLTELERNIGIPNSETSFLSPVVNQLDRHFTALNRRSRASVHVRSLRALQKQAERVEQLEQAIWAGKGLDDWVVDALRDASRLVGGEGWEEIEGTKAASAIQARLQLFRSMLLEQVSDAFGQAIHLDSTKSEKSEATLRVSADVQLQRPRIPRPEDRSSASNAAAKPEPTSYTIHELYGALSRLGTLGSLLQALSTRIIRDLIRPLVEHSGRHRLAKDAAGQGHLSLTTSPPTTSSGSGSTTGTERVILDLELFFDFVNSAVFPASIDLLERTSFLHDIASPTLALLLDSVLLPSMPSSIPEIPDWLRLLDKAATLEASLRPPEMKIRPFLDDQAGPEWIAAQRRMANERVKALVLNGWCGWDAKEVTRDKEVTSLVEVEMDDNELGQDGTASNAERSVTSQHDTEPTRMGADGGTEVEMGGDDDEAGGWGFDEDPPDTESKIPAGAETRSRSTSGSNVQVQESQDDGWDFDLDSQPAPSPPTATAVPTAPAPKPAKPVREAKKLGKRVAKTKHAEPAGLEMEEETVAKRSDPHPAPTRLRAESHQSSSGMAPNTDSDGWGWDEPDTPAVPVPHLEASRAEPSTPKRHKRTVLQEQKRMVKETYLVSKACDRLLEVTEFCLSEGRQLSSSSSLPTNFTSSAYLLQAAATDTLDIFRALIFTSQASQIRDVPTLSMQLSNDFTYLSTRLLELSTTYTWDVKDLVRRVKAAGEHVFETQLNVQRDGLMALLDEAEGWEGVGMVTGSRRCERVVNGVHHNLDSLARVLRVVLPIMSYYNVMGYLVDVVVERISAEVLALQDITEAESEKLNELLRVLHPLEKIFTESDPPTSIVPHVPHWLKYQYLSELLSANLVDIAYLHDTGALVDFTTEELVGIIKALFADSEKRDRAIEKIERESDRDRQRGPEHH